MLTSTSTHAICFLLRARDAIRRRTGEDRGASLVEYALLFALIVMVCIGAVTLLGSETGDSVSRSADSVAVAN